MLLVRCLLSKVIVVFFFFRGFEVVRKLHPVNKFHIILLIANVLLVFSDFAIWLDKCYLLELGWGL